MNMNHRLTSTNMQSGEKSAVKTEIREVNGHSWDTDGAEETAPLFYPFSSFSPSRVQVMAPPVALSRKVVANLDARLAVVRLLLRTPTG